VQGQVLRGENEPLAGATISAFDLGSNEPLTIRTTADLARGTANPPAPVTDAQGRFDIAVQDADPAKALRIVATRGEERYVTVTERWRAGARPAGYRLRATSATGSEIDCTSRTLSEPDRAACDEEFEFVD
jgi:hypothetical protein